jgi:hypothetical protein
MGDLKLFRLAGGKADELATGWQWHSQETGIVTQLLLWLGNGNAAIPEDFFDRTYLPSAASGYVCPVDDAAEPLAR